MRLVVAAVLSGGIAETAAQTQRRPIEARDGDLIMVDDVARVRLVRRREANVRAIYDPQLQRLRLLIDFAVSGGEPDGQVDQSRYFDNLNPAWPLNDRWESRATIHEYWLSAGEVSPPSGMGLVTPAGLIQFAPAGSRDDLRQFVDAPPLAVLMHGRAGRTSVAGLSFDAAEQQPVDGPRMSTQLSVGVADAARSAPSGTPAPAGTPAPIRVGGNIRRPTQIHDVRPVYPEVALAARVTGVVIIEAIIGTDGTVTDAKVLRSIPLLDNAALDAVRQWRYETTYLNGAPVPVIMTVTVSFNLQ